MRSLVSAANAIAPTLAVGTLYRRPDGRLAMNYWSEPAFGAHRFTDDDLPFALVNPPAGPFQASIDELATDPQRPFEVLMSVIGMKRKDADLRMKQQGYIKKNVTELEDGGSSYFWWNRDTHECLRVVAKDSKIKNVKSSKKESCD